VVESWHGHGMDMDIDAGVSVAVALGPPYKFGLDWTRTRWWAGMDTSSITLIWVYDSDTGLPRLSWRVDGVKHYMGFLSDLACFAVSWIYFVCIRLLATRPALGRFFLPPLSCVFRTGWPLVRFISLEVLHWLSQSHN
jgi:hypothetical protein